MWPVSPWSRPSSSEYGVHNAECGIRSPSGFRVSLFGFANGGFPYPVRTEGARSCSRYTLRVRFDVIVVGAGHAGIEAALASARMGLNTACITMRLDRIGHLPCNCSIGGPAKGHMAREVDALGGQMGVTTDYALTHIRRVGTGRGPAVQTIRAHVCKDLYPQIMR